MIGDHSELTIEIRKYIVNELGTYYEITLEFIDRSVSW